MKPCFLNLTTVLTLSCISLLTYGKPISLEDLFLPSTQQLSLGNGSGSSLGITLTNSTYSGYPLCLGSMTFVPYSDVNCGTAQISSVCIESTGLISENTACEGANRSVYKQMPISVGGTLHWLPQSIYGMGSGLSNTYYNSSSTECIQITNIQASVDTGHGCAPSGGTTLSFSGTSSNISVSGCGSKDTCTFGTTSISLALT